MNGGTWERKTARGARIRAPLGCAALCWALLICVPAGPVHAASSLESWTFNVDGSLFVESYPAGADHAGFDETTGLGEIVLYFNPGAAGSYSAIAFFDHEFVETLNGFSNENGQVEGSPASGQSYEIDEPGYVSGDIYTNVEAGALDNTNSVPSGSENDVSMALGWSFSLSAAEMATITLTVASQAPPAGTFHLVHNDPESQESIYLFGDLDIVATRFSLTTECDPAGGGSVTPAGTTLHDPDAQVQVEAHSNAGYVFTEWSGGLTGSENPVMITMDENKTVTAHFEEEPVVIEEGIPSLTLWGTVVMALLLLYAVFAAMRRRRAS